MSLMGTLAKVAIGYATAKGVDKMSGGGGLGALLGGNAGAGAETGDAAAANPLAQMMQQMTGGAGAGGMDIQAMLGGLMGGNTGAAPAADAAQGGLMSSLGGGAGIAGLLAAAGGAATMGGKGLGSMLDQFQSGTQAPELEDTAALLLRAMIQAAKADGEIDDAERAKILETVGDDASAEDIAFVQEQLAAPVDIAGLAAATPDAMKMQVYSMSMMSIRVDTAAEQDYMDALAAALELDPMTTGMLKMQMGVAS